MPPTALGTDDTAENKTDENPAPTEHAFPGGGGRQTQEHRYGQREKKNVR